MDENKRFLWYISNAKVKENHNFQKENLSVIEKEQLRMLFLLYFSVLSSTHHQPNITEQNPTSYTKDFSCKVNHSPVKRATAYLLKSILKHDFKITASNGSW